MSLAGLQKIAKAQAGKGGNYIKDGRYLFEIEKVINEQKSNGECFIIELRVRESTKTVADVEPNAVGTTCSAVYNLDKHQSAAGNVKAFILGLFGADESTTSDTEIFETAQELISAKQPARGMLIRDETFRKPKKSNPSEVLTLHKWVTVNEASGNSADEIAKRRAALDGNNA